MTATVAPKQLSADAAGAVEVASLALVEMTMTALAASGNLSPLQMRLLLVVDRHAPLNLSALARHLDQSIPSASRLVDRLVESGLVRRGAAPHSRREVALTLTAKGRRALGRLREIRQRAIADVLARMTATDREALVSGLTAFAAAADD
jgi:DNA-binding MarR family transcriptional regulator